MALHSLPCNKLKSRVMDETAGWPTIEREASGSRARRFSSPRRAPIPGRSKLQCQADWIDSSRPRLRTRLRPKTGALGFAPNPQPAFVVHPTDFSVND